MRLCAFDYIFRLLEPLYSAMDEYLSEKWLSSFDKSLLDDVNFNE